MDQVDINDVRRWFGDAWRVNSRCTEYEHAEHTLMRIGCDAHGWYYVADMISVADECESLRELAAKVRAWHLKQARAIRVEWVDEEDPAWRAYDSGGSFLASVRDRLVGRRFMLWVGHMTARITTEQATALRDFLDERLAMVPPKEDA